jgi:Tol biopolymer transport system component
VARLNFTISFIGAGFDFCNWLINQKNNGNGVYHPSGEYIVFISEENAHLQDHLKYLADSGLGLYCNLWAIDIAAKKTWKLTDIPIKKSLLDKSPAIAVINPHFTPDEKTLIWTERYAKGGHHNWGMWRIKSAAFNSGKRQAVAFR